MQKRDRCIGIKAQHRPDKGMQTRHHITPFQLLPRALGKVSFFMDQVFD